MPSIEVKTEAWTDNFIFSKSSISRMLLIETLIVELRQVVIDKNDFYSWDFLKSKAVYLRKNPMEGADFIFLTSNFPPQSGNCWLNFSWKKSSW